MTGIRKASLEASFGFSPELRAKALVEAIEKLYVEDLLTREPEGDA